MVSYDIKICQRSSDSIHIVCIINSKHSIKFKSSSVVSLANTKLEVCHHHSYSSGQASSQGHLQIPFETNQWGY